MSADDRDSSLTEMTIKAHISKTYNKTGFPSYMVSSKTGFPIYMF